MNLVLIGVVVAAVLVFAVVRFVQMMRRREVEQYSIEAETLHELMENNPELMVFDVRQPLDLLAHSEIIPGAKRVAPKEIIDQAALLPKDKDSVIYCTCVSQKTSRMIIERAMKLDFKRVKFLRGGLDAWKAKGYPVVRYDTPFHLDTAR